MSLSTVSRGARAWVLNLDAEHEFESSAAYMPTERLRKIVALQSKALHGPLVLPQDVVLEEGRPPDPRAVGLPGHAWSMTPRARARLAAAGAIPVDAPDIGVLRKVNARSFARAVRAQFIEQQPTGSFNKDVAGNLDEVLSLVGRPAHKGWLVRRPFGAAGRGRKRLFAGKPTPAELSWLKASLGLGPLVVEPFVEIAHELTRSGLVRPDGSVVIAGPGVQVTSGIGAWRATQPASKGDVSTGDDNALEAACQAAGDALARSGFFGPFGIDAFRHRQGAHEVLNPLSEINARLTMDWTLTMGQHCI